MSSGRLVTNCYYCRLRNGLGMLTCCRRKKNRTLSHLKMQCVPLCSTLGLNVTRGPHTARSSLGARVPRGGAPAWSACGSSRNRSARPCLCTVPRGWAELPLAIFLVGLVSTTSCRERVSAGVTPLYMVRVTTANLHDDTAGGGPAFHLET